MVGTNQPPDRDRMKYGSVQGVSMGLDGDNNNEGMGRRRVPEEVPVII